MCIDYSKVSISIPYLQTCDFNFQFLIHQSPEAEVEVVSWDSLLLGYTLALVKTFLVVSRFMISFL